MRAPDDIIMSWARENVYIVFTHDLDFGVLLALTRAESPSVIQVRTQDVFPGVLGDRRLKVLREHQSVLEKGALLTVDEGKSGVRVLPFGKDSRSELARFGFFVDSFAWMRTRGAS